MVAVPAQYQGLINQAAGALGISPDIVAAQIQYESGFNPQAVSPTGAQGIAQFEPGTWSTYGAGSPFDPAAAMTAYTKYMQALLVQEGGDVSKALAAYNAGPGNLGAGAGYASHILSVAGQPAKLHVPGLPSIPTPSSVLSGNLGGPSDTCLIGIGGSILSLNVGVCFVSKVQARDAIGGLLIALGSVVGLVALAVIYRAEPPKQAAQQVWNTALKQGSNPAAAAKADESSAKGGVNTVVGAANKPPKEAGSVIKGELGKGKGAEKAVGGKAVSAGRALEEVALVA